MSEEVKENRVQEKKNWFDAKNISKFFKYLCGIGAVVCMVLKWVGILPNAATTEIGLGWLIVYGIGAGTIDTNIIIDKFLNREQKCGN